VAVNLTGGSYTMTGMPSGWSATAAEVNAVDDIAIGTIVRVFSDEGGANPHFEYELSDEATVAAGNGISVDEDPANTWTVTAVGHADEAVQVTADGIGVVPNAEAAIAVSASGVAVVADTANAIAVSESGVAWVPDTDQGLDVADDKAIVKLDSGGPLVFTEGGDINVDLTHFGGLVVAGTSGTELRVAVYSVGGLMIDPESDNGLRVLLDNSDSCLDCNSDGLFVVAKADSGILVDDAGLMLEVKADSGLDEDLTDGLAVLPNADKGMAVDADGLAVVVEGSDLAYTKGNEEDGWITFDASGNVAHGDPQTTLLDTTTL